MKITKQQLCEVLNLINNITESEVGYNIERGTLKDTITIFYCDRYGCGCSADIYVCNGIVENPRISELEKEIRETEDRLAKLKGEFAELKKED